MSLWSMEVAIPVQHEAGILAVELAAGNRMVYYTRTGHWTVDFSP